MRKSFLILLCITIKAVEVSSLQTFILNEDSSNRQTCMSKILQNEDEIIWFVDNNFDWFWINSSNHVYAVTNNVTIFTRNLREPFRNRVPTGVLINPTFNVIEGILHENFEYNLKYVLIFEEFKAAKPLIDMIFRHGINNVLIAIYTDNEIKVYHNHNQRFMNSLSINCSNDFEELNIFRKTPRNYFTNYTLNVAWIPGDPFVMNAFDDENPGLFIKTIKVISTRAKMNLFFFNEPEFYKEFKTEGTIKKLVSTLTNRRSDVAMGYTFVNWSMFDYGPVFYKDQILLTMYKPKATASLKQLSKIFKSIFWIILFAIYIVVTAIFRILLQERNLENVVKLHLSILQISINMSGSLLLRKDSVKTLLLFYSFHSLLITTIYLAKLSSTFTQQTYERPIITLGSFYVNGLKTCIHNYVSTLLNLKYINTENKYSSSIVTLSEEPAYNCIHEIAVSQNGTCTVFEGELDSYPSEKLLLSYFNPMFVNMTLFNTFLMRKHNPINKVIKFWALEIVEKGIFLKWWKDMKENRVNVSLLEGFDQEENNFVKLTYKHYEQTFLILYIGLSLSAIIFLVEFFIKYLSDKIDWMITNSAI